MRRFPSGSLSIIASRLSVGTELSCMRRLLKIQFSDNNLRQTAKTDLMSFSFFCVYLIWKLIYCSNIHHKRLLAIITNKWLQKTSIVSVGFSPSPDSPLPPNRKSLYRTSCNINFNISWTWMMIDDTLIHSLGTVPYKTVPVRDLYCEIMMELLCCSFLFFATIIINFMRTREVRKIWN